MSEAILPTRCGRPLSDWLAVLLCAGLFATVLALLVEGALALWPSGAGSQDPARLLAPLRAERLLLLWLAGLALMLIPARHIGPTLIARYDGEALLAPPSDGSAPAAPGPEEGAARHCAWHALHDWCFKETGSGRRPLWRPWHRPEIPQRLSLAVLTGPRGSGKSRLAQALCRELDGSVLLAACPGRVAGLRLRLGVKLAECLWWRRRQADDPWDAGVLDGQPARLQRLGRFRPRRATLIVADELPPEALDAAIAQLSAAAPCFEQPVRLLIVAERLPAQLAYLRSATISM